jgi:hypothetical protein
VHLAHLSRLAVQLYPVGGHYEGPPRNPENVGIGRGC